MDTFSGAHPFRPACLTVAYKKAAEGEHSDPVDLHEAAIEFAARAVEMADAGQCPCCGGSFAEGEIPSGSRITSCRCVPVCMGCSRREAFGSYLSVTDLMGLREWAAAGDEERTAHGVAREVAALEVIRGKRRRTPGFTATDTEGDPIGHTEGGAGPLSVPHAGGWAKYGYTDEQDRRERER